MNNKVNINFSNTNISYNSNNNHGITMINKNATKSPGDVIGGLVDTFTETMDVSEKKDEKIYNEVMNMLDGSDLPMVYKEAVAESITEVLGDKFVLSSNGAKRKLIKNFSEVAAKMREKGFKVSPLLNNLINMYYPSMNANMSEEYAESLMSYLYSKSKKETPYIPYAKTYDRPIDELMDIFKEDDELNKYGKLLSFLIDANGTVDLNYDTVKKQMPGIIDIYQEKIPSELDKYGIYSNPKAQTDENYKKLWDSILNKRKKGSYDAMLELFPYIAYDMDAYIENEYGYTIKGLDMDEALKNISGNFPSFLKKLSRLDNNDGFEQIEDINIMLNFLGADTGDKLEIIFNNTFGS